jgi:tetratricopeptide (TPR) repeat protein
MNYDAPTVRNILGAIRKDPLNTEQWHNLLIHCFDQKDSDSFESYQIISDCLDNLVRAEKLIGLGRGSDGKILLNNEQRLILIQLSMEPNDSAALEGLGRILFQDFCRRSEAHRVFARALKLDPVNAEIHRWLERCGDGSATSASALEIEPESAVSALIQPKKQNSDIRRLMRVTSKVAIDKEVRKVADADADAPVQELPAPLPVANDLHPALGNEEEFLEEVDLILAKAIQGQADDCAGSVARLQTKSTSASVLATSLALAAHIHHSKGRHETALELYQQAITAAPVLSSLYYFQATVYHELGRREEAKNVYQSVIAKFPGNGQAWAGLGILHYELEEYEDSEVCLRKAVSLQPQSAKWWGHLASVLIERGESVQALEAVDQLEQIEPGSTDVWLKRGVIHLQMNDLESARRALAQLLEKDADSVPGSCYLAMVRARAGHPDEALILCRQIAVHPELNALISTAWLETGLAFERLEDFPQALLCLKAAVELDASQAQAWTRMGLICRRNGALEESEIALAQAVKADPSEIRGWSELGITRYRVGRFPEAAEAFLRAADLDPAVSDWPYNAGVAYEKASLIDPAAKAYERAVKVQTDHASARINLGLIYVQQGHPAKAASCLQGLVLVRPDYGRAWFGLGLVYEGMQKWEEALRSLQKAVDLDPTLLEAFSHLSYVYRKLGREDEAKAAASRSNPEVDPVPAA